MLDLLYARAGQDIRGELLERMGKSPATPPMMTVFMPAFHLSCLIA